MSTQASLSAALPPAVKSPTTRYDSFGLTRSVPPRFAPLKRRDMLRLTIASPLPASRSRPWTIVKSGRSISAAGFPPGFEAGSMPRMIRFARSPPTRSTTGMWSSSPLASTWPWSSRAIPGRLTILSDLSELDPADGLGRRPLAQDDQVERVARELQAVLEPFDQAEEAAGRPDDQAGADHGHQGVDPADRRLRTLYLSGTIAVQTTFRRPLTTESLRRPDGREEAAEDPDTPRRRSGRPIAVDHGT